jgi:hypothetical protein
MHAEPNANTIAAALVPAKSLRRVFDVVVAKFVSSKDIASVFAFTFAFRILLFSPPYAQPKK